MKSKNCGLRNHKLICSRRRNIGFTLFEILLVLAVMSGLMIMALRFVTQRIEETRRDRTVLQIQEILNAGLSYYVSHGQWPVKDGICDKSAAQDLSILKDQKEPYLPDTFNLNPYGRTYTVRCDPDTNNFTVITDLPTANPAELQIIAGRLPLAYIPQGTGAAIVEASVNIPGQNLNNARAVNFGNLYKHGACVPAPKCPNKNMTPQIIVIPISVSGLNDFNSQNVYPISSFTAYAIGDPSGKPVKGNEKIPGCINPNQSELCKPGDTGKIDDNTDYWRVCLKVVTERGDVYQTNTDPSKPSKEGDWGKNVTVLAITRCSPEAEPIGSSFEVFRP